MILFSNVYSLQEKPVLYLQRLLVNIYRENSVGGRRPYLMQIMVNIVSLLRKILIGLVAVLVFIDVLR